MVDSIHESNISMCQPCAKCQGEAAMNQADLGPSLGSLSLVREEHASDNRRTHHLGTGPGTDGLLSQGFVNEGGNE